jgi:hypothetical protein
MQMGVKMRGPPPSNRGAVLVVIIALASLSASCTSEPVPLSFTLPASARTGVASDDGVLCSKLSVDFTFDRVGDGEGPLLDKAALANDDDENPCTFSLPSADHAFRRGTYDVFVRFLAAPGAFSGSDSCTALGFSDEKPVFVGAYVKSDMPFPEPAPRFDDEDFLSRPNDAGELPVSGVSFDIDGDARDNLAELAAGSDPCVENAPPTVSLSVDPLVIDEGQAVSITLDTNDPALLRHRLTLSLRHANGPNAGTEVVTYRRYTSAPTEEVIAPDKGVLGIDEGWSLIATDVVEHNSGAATVTLSFVADEPFIGAITASLVADDGAGTTLASAPDVVFTVNDILDPPTLLVDDGEGAFTPVDRLDFREVGPGVTPSTLRLKLEADAVSGALLGLVPVLGATAPPGFALETDLSGFTLTWAPDNAVLLAAPVDGYTLPLDFVDDQASPVVQFTYPIGITPLYNDAPALDLTAVDATLSSGTFALKLVRFHIDDPDMADGPPSCVATVSLAEGTTCNTPFAEILCEIDGPREGTRWPAVVALTPRADYSSACGESPAFFLSLSATDQAPPGAVPAAGKTVSTVDSCGNDDGCVEDIRLYTAEVASSHPVALTGDGAGASEFTPPLVDGVSGMAVVGGRDIDFNDRIYLADVSSTTPSITTVLPATVMCNFVTEFGVGPPVGVVDEVNHRIFAMGYRDIGDGTCWDTDQGAILVDTITGDVTALSMDEVCPQSSCPYFLCDGTPTTDSVGNIYVPCGGDSGGVVTRIAPDGTMTTKSLIGREDTQGVKGFLVLPDETGREWLVWPDWDGLHVTDLDTWDTELPTSERVIVPDWYEPRLEDAEIDVARASYVFVLAKGFAFDPGPAQVWRLRMSNGVASIDGPIEIGDVGNTSNGDVYLRLVLRPPSPLVVPDDEPDLLISGDTVGGVRPHIDLDADPMQRISLFDEREASEYFGVFEIYTSPDPRYFFGISRGSSSVAGFDGIFLYTWDPFAARQSQELVADFPFATPYQSGVVTSVAGGISIVQTSGALTVVRFNQAPGLLD